MADSNAGMDPTGSLAPEWLTPNYINPAYSTPAQIAQLRVYADSLLSPQPVQHWAQGLGEIARSLMGGYLGRQSDLREAAIQQHNAADTTKIYTPLMTSTTPASAAAPPIGDTTANPDSNPAPVAVAPLPTASADAPAPFVPRRNWTSALFSPLPPSVTAPPFFSGHPASGY